MPFKIYTSLSPIALPLSFEASSIGALSAIAGAQAHSAITLDVAALTRLCYFSNGVTKLLRGMPFRAAACTGALYHIEEYLICGDLPDLAAGIYHFGAHDNGLRQLRSGDFRQVVIDATGGEPHVAQAPVVMALTSTWWRNAWKYQARAYRHAFWDSGTVLANLLAVAAANGLSAQVLVGFADSEVNALLDVDPDDEAAIALVALGSGSPAASNAPEVPPLHLETRPLSPHQLTYPPILEAHAASSLESGEAAAQWRSQFTPPTPTRPAAIEGESMEAVILRRGSTRQFSHAPIPLDALETMVRAATASIPCDAFVATDLYLIVHAVEGLDSGSYVYNRDSHQLELLRAGDFRREAALLDLGQELAGDAALNAYWLVNLDRLDNRGYRAAQLSAAIEGGKLYLAAYALRIGATGLTFFDDDVIHFFSPHATGKSVMFLDAVGVKARAGRQALR